MTTEEFIDMVHEAGYEIECELEITKMIMSDGSIIEFDPPWILEPVDISRN